MQRGTMSSQASMSISCCMRRHFLDKAAFSCLGPRRGAKEAVKAVKAAIGIAREAAEATGICLNEWPSSKGATPIQVMMVVHVQVITL